MEGLSKFESTRRLANVPYHRVAELGPKNIYVDDLERVGTAWDEALAAGVPVVLEVTDRKVPTLPLHITFEQAQPFMNAFMQGEPDEGGMVEGAVRQVLASLTPERER